MKLLSAFLKCSLNNYTDGDDDVKNHYEDENCGDEGFYDNNDDDDYFGNIEDINDDVNDDDNDDNNDDNFGDIEDLDILRSQY